MNKKRKQLHQLTVTEFLAIPKSELSSMVQASAIEAVNYSIVHGDITKATTILGILSSIFKHPNSKQCLTSYLTKWGNLEYVKNNDCFIHIRKLRPDEWTEAYEAKVSECRWDRDLKKSSAARQTELDAAVEIRKLIARLEKISCEPGAKVSNSALIPRVRTLLFDFDPSSTCHEKGKQVQTLFDASITNRTLRAGKFAKGS
jgi:hypothetical protein